MIKFSVSGTFKEGKPADKVRPLRSFHRVFVCIPDTVSPMTIVNEQFTISQITNGQHKVSLLQAISEACFLFDLNQVVSISTRNITTCQLKTESRFIKATWLTRLQNQWERLS